MSKLRNLLSVGVVSLVAATLTANSFAAEARWDPTTEYHPRQVEGWRVLVNKRLDCDEHRTLCHETLKLLGDHLYRIARVVPTPALTKLRTITVWVELAHPKHPCMCYHPSSEWLRQHDMNPEKSGSIEIANAEKFLKWTHAQPWMVLHELAHGYHHLFVGHDNQDLEECFRRAMSAKKYESVLHINGKRQRHYALSNSKEYFAEASEAFFGTNDFYPFVRSELKEHDSDLYALLRKLWGVEL